MTDGLVALVESKTAITNLIGTSPTRFFPRKIPQGVTTYPSATYRVVSIDPRNTFDGASTYDFWAVDIHSYGRDYTDAENVAQTIRTQIEESSGTFGGVDIDHVWFNGGGIEDWIEELELYTIQYEYRIATRR